MARWPAREQPLRPLFSDEVGQLGDGFIPCGVCAVRLSGRTNSPAIDWAVCPHRLFSFHSERGSDAQRPLRQRVLDLAGFENGERVEVWSEVALRDAATHVNYRLDYVLMSADRDCAPVIVEVMTASIFGGNIRQGTDIKTAFCNAVLYAHGLRDEIGGAPGVNTRQVWARMASQLVVKSEIANAWGGCAIWIIQDALLDYIRTNTGLQVDALHSPTWRAGEVNVISANLNDPNGLNLFSGPIRAAIGTLSWTELLSAPGIPSVTALRTKLKEESIVARIRV